MKCIREVPRKKGVAYVAEVRLNGFPPLRKTFKTEDEAKEFIKLKKAVVTTGGKWNSATLEKTKLEVVFRDYISTHKTALDGKVQYTKNLSKHKEHLINFLEFDLGGLRMEQLTHQRIAKYFQTLLITPIPPRQNKKKSSQLYNGDENKCYSEPTVGKYFSLLRQVMTDFAFKHEYDLGRRFDKHESFTNWRPRTVRISDKEQEKIIEACSRLTNEEQVIQYRQLFNLALHTGLRASELMKLKAQNCNLDEKFIFVARETNKLKKSRSTPFGMKALEILTENFKNKTEEEIKNGILVFDKLPKAGLDLRIKEIMFKAGCKHIRLSDYRHEFIIRVLSLTNIDVAKLALASGHNLKVLLVYAQEYRPHYTASAELDKI